MRVSHTLSVNRTTANGVHLRHDLQVTDDVAVRRNIAKDTAWVRIRVRSVRSSARWTFATSSIPEVGLQSVLITEAIVDRFFGFSPGLIHTVCLGSTKFLCLGHRLRHVNPLG